MLIKLLRVFLKRQNSFKTDIGDMKVLDVTINAGMVNSIVEVVDNTVGKGNVELKIYNPSLNKKKGATMELRKMSSFEYTHVELLKSMLIIFLDGFIAGDDVNEVLKNFKKGSVPRARVTSKPRLFNCDQCNWQTKFSSALKVHKTRIHSIQSQTQIKCDECTFQPINQTALNAHKDSNHKQRNKRTKESNSPTTSPPSKKHDGVFIEDDDESEVEMFDFEIEAGDVIKRMLESRIMELENIISEMKEQMIKDESIKNGQKLPQHKSIIPHHLSQVAKEHHSKLRGYKLRYKAEPNGACLDNCLAVHVYEDEDEGPKVKKRLNHHVAENWDNYYKHKIPLPYEETVGVGEYSKQIRVTNREEMFEFLSSEDALMVYSNSQQILAMANLFNINISIFTYGGAEERWTEVRPDPEMVVSAEIKFGKWVPDMALYHNEDSHFDLLVKDHSRLALLGLLAGTCQENDPLDEPRKTNKNTDVTEEELLVANETNVGDLKNLIKETNKEESSDEWETVKKVKRKSNKNKDATEEELLVESEPNGEDSESLGEEQILLNSKLSGHRRTGPQEPSVTFSEEKMFNCDQCDSELESVGLLNAHFQIHHAAGPIFHCQQCDRDFRDKCDLDNHITELHPTGKRAGDWNCNDCSFQANNAMELMNHLKITSHQPSKEIDRRKTFKDYKQCYTCSEEFDGYYNLMTHRKTVHPSNKKCRNFPMNCPFGANCWYKHEEPMETDHVEDNSKTWSFKCDLCDEKLSEKRDFMAHKKAKHGDTILNCEQFIKGLCSRSEEACWFKHSSPGCPQERKSTQEQVFQKAPHNLFPPDKMSKVFQAINTLCMKMENMEKRFQDLMD